MKKVITMLFVLSFVVVISTSSAMASLTLANVDGDWSNPVGGQNINYYNGIGVGYGNGLQDQIRWGVDIGNGQSGLGFTGVADGAIINIAEPFEIGQLVHFNNSVGVGSSASAADLSITLTFGAVGYPFTFTLGVNETLNEPGPVDDVINFPNSLASESVEIEGTLYTLELLGFGDTPDALVNSFISPEGTVNATKLWGNIVPVPVPGALLLGLIGVGTIRLKLRRFFA
jgi:hypothetical protein